MAAIVYESGNDINSSNATFKALKKCYLSQTSLKVVFDLLFSMEDEMWKAVEGQINILKNIVNSKIAVDYPVAFSYKKKFLTKYFNHLMREGSPMSDILAETSTKVAALSNSQGSKTSFKTYIFDNVINNTKDDELIIALSQCTDLGKGMTTGFKIWPCSYTLTKFLLNLPITTSNNRNSNLNPSSKFIKDKKVLEIGCGTGFVGIGLCNLSLNDQPNKLVLSDFSASVLSNMIDNVIANNFSVSSRDFYAGSVSNYFAKINGSKEQGEPWEQQEEKNNDDDTDKKKKKSQVIVEPLMFDVRQAYTSENDLKQISTYFDTIIASDMIYDVDLCVELMRVFNTVLSFDPNFVILLSTENRRSDTNITFNECLEKYHLNAIEVMNNDLNSDNVYFGNNLGVISLYQLCKNIK
eukprot:g5640.t1